MSLSLPNNKNKESRQQKMAVLRSKYFKYQWFEGVIPRNEGDAVRGLETVGPSGLEHSLLFYIELGKMLIKLLQNTKVHFLKYLWYHLK